MTPNAPSPKPSLEEPVTRTYDVGLRFEGQTRTQRLKAQFFAYETIKTLQYKAYDKLTDDRIIEADHYLREHPQLKGITGSAKLRKHLKDCSNLGEAVYLPLLGALKGVHKTEKKLEKFLPLCQAHPQEFFEWLVFGRAPYLERQFQYAIYRTWGFARNTLLNARHKIDPFLPALLQLAAALPELSEAEWGQIIEQAFHTKQTAFQALEQTTTPPTQKQQAFLRKLEVLNTEREQLAPLFVNWVFTWNNPSKNTPKSRWQHLSHLTRDLETVLNQMPYYSYQKHALRSAVRTIIMTAVQPLYQEGWTVDQLVETVLRPEQMVSLPFLKKNQQTRFQRKIPLQLLMGSEYVVLRRGNSAVLTKDALEEGRTPITIYPERKKRQGVQADVLFHDKIRQFLRNGASISSLKIAIRPGPARKLRLQVTMKGAFWMFLSQRQIHQYVQEFQAQQISLSEELVKGLGLDVNKPGPDMLAFSEAYQLLADIERVIQNYDCLKTPLQQLGKGLTRIHEQFRRFPSVFTQRCWLKLKTELELVYARRKRLLRTLHNQSSRFITAVLVHSATGLFSVEDLRLSAKGTRGPLARAILAMPDEPELFDVATVTAEWIQGLPIALERVDPRNTSQAPHLDCVMTPPGRLSRKPTNPNVGVCSGCQTEENIHTHAARVIRNRGYAQHQPPPD